MRSDKYYTYMLRCVDDSIYTGITTDLERRMDEHFGRGEKCAKYTMSRAGKKLERAWMSSNRKLASKLEYHIKKLSKKNKEEIIVTPEKIEIFLEGKIEYENYKEV